MSVILLVNETSQAQFRQSWGLWPWLFIISTRFKLWPLKWLTVLSATASGLKAGNCETNEALAENETANVLLSRTAKCWHYINEGTMNMENWWDDADAENWSVGVTNSEIHNQNTRQLNNIHKPRTNLSKYLKVTSYLGVNVHNNLPLCIKDKIDKPKKVQNQFKNILLLHSFYSLEEFFQYKSNWSL